MNLQNEQQPIDNIFIKDAASVTKFMSNVFLYMTGALALTGFVAYWAAGQEVIMNSLRNVEGGLNILGYAVMFSPLIFVLIMSFAFNRLSYTALFLLFAAYSFVNGISFSFIFHYYTSSAIATTFFITAGTFSLMALLGYTTKTDLTKFGSILYMGLIGIILASLVNWFLGNSTLDYIISIFGVLIFTGLTAYDVQKLKNIGAGQANGDETTKKLVLMGALTLYLDFINLFLFLLRLFGGSRN